MSEKSLSSPAWVDEKVSHEDKSLSEKIVGLIDLKDNPINACEVKDVKSTVLRLKEYLDDRLKMHPAIMQLDISKKIEEIFGSELSK